MECGVLNHSSRASSSIIKSTSGTSPKVLSIVQSSTSANLLWRAAMNARSSAILRDRFQVASMVSFVFFRISTLFFVLSLSTYLDPSIYTNKMQTNCFLIYFLPYLPLLITIYSKETLCIILCAPPLKVCHYLHYTLFVFWSSQQRQQPLTVLKV